MSELVRGAHTPLFDRLAVPDGDKTLETLLTPEQLKWSIARDLSRLLNTRSRLLSNEFLSQAATTLDYGMPDISALSPRSESDLMLLQTLVRHAVQCFEPRLQHVEVQASASDQAAGGVALLISGMVRIGLMLKQLHFELQLNQHHSTQRIGAV
jgi:type VI secretion system protein ImpF